MEDLFEVRPGEDESLRDSIVKTSELLPIPYRGRGLFVERERETAAQMVREHVGETYGSAEGFMLLAQAEDILSRAMVLLKEDAIQSMPAKGPMELLGGALTLRRDAKYDYSGDTTLENLEAKAKDLAQQIKERREFLRKLKVEVADVNTGIIIKPARQLSEGVNLAVSLPK